MKILVNGIVAFTLASSFLACDKKEEFMIQGRIMHDCDTPASNISYLTLSQSYVMFNLGKSPFSTDFTTDSNGYFKVVYKRNAANGTHFQIDNFFHNIPAYQNLDVGDVFLNGPILNYVRRLEVNNTYTVNDTLIIRDYNAPNGFLEMAGPFQNGIIDTVWNVEGSKYVWFNITPIYDVQYRFNLPIHSDWSTAEFPITDFCTDDLYELVIKI